MIQTGVQSCTIRVPASEVFKTVYDYAMRLKWDTMLSSAAIISGQFSAGTGVVTRCLGKGWMKLFPIEAVYLTYKPDRVAAVKMVNRSLLFGSFSASIRHETQNVGSTVCYKYAFRLRWYARFLTPIAHSVLSREVAQRLNGLKNYCEKTPATF
ncbi:hypothetical protein BSZ32_15945 [Rubritalea profundi]|uniref:Polyketide cyclase n=2 Tax=Rubritalea profundi TaxID=1658618 RepID=A0A2S7U602_9BACT|nr:hypothetical protein BSZ32_15945 [Rubritalea profundi]